MQVRLLTSLFLKRKREATAGSLPTPIADYLRGMDTTITYPGTTTVPLPNFTPVPNVCPSCGRCRDCGQPTTTPMVPMPATPWPYGEPIRYVDWNSQPWCGSGGSGGTSYGATSVAAVMS